MFRRSLGYCVRTSTRLAVVITSIWTSLRSSAVLPRLTASMTTWSPGPPVMTMSPEMFERSSDPPLGSGTVLENFSVCC